MSSIPHVSVLMPTFNHGNYIGTAIESVLEQTFQDFELIISDNASSDNTQEIITSYLKRDKRIKCFRNQTNVGGHANFNIALRYASESNHFIVLSSDDWWHPQLLEHLVHIAEKHPNTTLIHSDTYRVDEQGKIVNKYSDLWPTMPPIGEYRSLRELFLHGCYFNLNATLVNRTNQKALYSENDLFDPSLKYTADYHLWLQLMTRGAYAHYLPKPLAFYRKHDAALTTQATAIYRLQEQIEIFSEKLKGVCSSDSENLRMQALVMSLKQLGFLLLSTERKVEAIPFLEEALRLAQDRQRDLQVAFLLSRTPFSGKTVSLFWRTLVNIAGRAQVRKSSSL